MWEVTIRECGALSTSGATGWSWWAGRPVGYQLDGIELIKADLGKVIDDYWTDSYGQGYTAETTLVFKVEVDEDLYRFFQKKGTQDSYGEIIWGEGAFEEVKMQSKKVTVWEPQ